MAIINKLNDIADAIREKTGENGLMTMAQMPSKIRSIESGGITPTGTIDINYNGEYNVTNYATADVNVNMTGAIDFIGSAEVHGASSIVKAVGLVDHQYDNTHTYTIKCTSAMGQYDSVLIYIGVGNELGSNCATFTHLQGTQTQAFTIRDTVPYNGIYWYIKALGGGSSYTQGNIQFEFKID